MTDSKSYVVLPPGLGAEEEAALAVSRVTDSEFTAHQVEFVRHLFGYAEYLRECSREMPVSDAFLPVFVMLLETFHLNAPFEARRCVSQLKQILPIMFGDLYIEPSPVAPRA